MGVKIIDNKFDELIRIYSNDLFRYIYTLTKDYHLSEDILQETFYKAYVNLIDYNEITNLKSWLFRVAYNTFIDYCRKNKKLSIFEDSYFNSLKIQSSLETEHIVLRNQDKEVIYKHLSEVKEKYRKAIILVDIQGLSYNEASKIMKIKLSYLKSLLFRGRKELKQKISSEVNSK